MPAAHLARKEGTVMDADIKKSAQQMNKTTVLLIAFRAALIAMIQAIEVYLDFPVSNRQSRRAK